MTYTATRYRTYEEYLASDISAEGDFRLLSSGNVIELPPEDIRNTSIADKLASLLKTLAGSEKLVKTSSVEMQVQPVGDGRVNRKPDVIVLRSEHWEIEAFLAKASILFEMPPPVFVAEVVSPGAEKSDNYRRDYVWKRQQYEWWQVPEYWILDRHRGIVTVLVLKDEAYQESVYVGTESDSL